jgi:small subunit ribosomal protein S6
MILNEYELVLILRPDLDDAVTQEVVDKVVSTVAENDGHLLLTDDWGSRKLAYPIKKHLKGHYFLINLLAPAALVTELERRIRITDAVIRFLTVKKTDDVDVTVRVEQAKEQQRLRDEAAAARAAEEAAAAEAAALAAAAAEAAAERAAAEAAEAAIEAPTEQPQA